MGCCCCCSNLLLALGAIIFAVYLYAQYKFSYWKKRNVHNSEASLPLGNIQGISRTSNLGGIIQKLYFEGIGLPAVGFYIFLSPQLLIRDPKIARMILSKDFSAFHGRGFKVDPKIDPLSGHLFFLDGPEWRALRAKLTPTFTSGKMRAMYPIIEDCSKEMMKYLKSSKSGSNVFETSDLFMRYTTNVITRSAFGLNVDFFRNPDQMFEKMIHRVGNPTAMDALKRGMAFAFATVFEKLAFRVVPKEVTEYFIGVVRDAINKRNLSKEKRKDFLQSMIELIDKGWLDDIDTPLEVRAKLNYEITAVEAAAQAFSFILGGFDTSGTTMQFCLYELAVHPEIQQLVRDEVQKVLFSNNNKLTYDALQELTYLDQVISETMRLHPIVQFLNRECIQHYKVPDTDILLEPGMKVWISASGMHSDPLYFPNPEKFDPERFSTENKNNIAPYSYLPFGEGPRACIGNRFALMQMKAGIAGIISEFKVKMCEQTQSPPLKINPKKGPASILGGVHLKFLPL